MLPNNNVNTEKSIKGCEQKRIEVLKFDWYVVSFKAKNIFMKILSHTNQHYTYTEDQ